MTTVHGARSRSLIISGLDANEIFCLDKQQLRPGPLLVGNSVQSLGFFGSVSAGVRNLAGGESVDITETIRAGRVAAMRRMEDDAKNVNALGVTGVSSELKTLSGSIEFLSTGSAVFGDGDFFTSSVTGKELFCMKDAGYQPKHFAFGNIAYSVGIGGGILGTLKSLGRGEIREFSDILNKTRHAALQRLIQEAKYVGANAVVGVEIDVQPFGGFHEMLMTGTAVHHPLLGKCEPVTCDLTCDELWSLTKMGYAPVKIVMGTAVYSLGVVGSLSSLFKSIRKGEISELTTMVYDAREHALDLLEQEARMVKAEMVMGTDVYIHELPGGLLEFMAIGTAVKKVDGIQTVHDTLPVQAVVGHKSTFRNSYDDMLAGRVETK